MPGYSDRARRQAATRTAMVFTVLGIVTGLAASHWIQNGPGPAMLPGTMQAGNQGLLLGIALLAALLAGVAFVRVRRGYADTIARDAVTALYTRQYVDEMVPRLMARDDRGGCSELALVLIGVDFLDDIRQRYGDRVVDEVMRLVGRQICGQARPTTCRRGSTTPISRCFCTAVRPTRRWPSVAACRCCCPASNSIGTVT